LAGQVQMNVKIRLTRRVRYAAINFNSWKSS
jgi:hypothetical protein